MHSSVPALGLLCMGATLLFAFGAPIGLLVYFRKRGARVLPFFVGCLTFVIFALVLEAAVHRLVLGSALGPTIQGNTLLYALYGGLMAGLFEETGRYLAISTVLKKQQDRDIHALMYGAGHGGAEAMLLLGLTYVNNLVFSLLINTGHTDLLTATVPPEALPQIQGVIDALISTPAYIYLLALVERAVALTIHLCLSALVWLCVTRKKGWLLPLSMLLHALVDAVTVLLSARLPLWAMEGCLVLFAAALALLTRFLWKANR